MDFSNEANRLIFWMIQQLSGCNYGYRQFVSGCYDAGIHNYGIPKPPEDKDVIVDHVIGVLNTL